MRRRSTRLLATLAVVLLLGAMGASTALARPTGSIPNDEAYYGKWIYSSSLPYTDVMDVAGATVNAFDLNNTCNSDDPGASVWYRFRATSTVDVTLDTIGSAYDTEITVFTTSGQYIDCNDDSSADPQNSNVADLTVHLQGGRTYLFRVDSYDNPPVCERHDSCATMSDSLLVFNVSIAAPI